MQLTESSEFLETQKEDLMNVWKGFGGKLLSFFETVETPSVRKVTTPHKIPWPTRLINFLVGIWRYRETRCTDTKS